MSSIQVPELYKENILKGEQKESGRKQLSMSHILGLSVNGDENHAQLGRVDIQTGRCVSPQEREEIPAKNSFCKAFSIRGYVTNIRETDISKCWPFPPHLLQRRMREKTVPLLPPLEVPTFRYWQCLDCVVSELHEIRNEQQQIDNLKNDIDNLINATPVHGDGKFALEPSENEHKDLGNGMENHLLSTKVGNDLEEDGVGIEVAQCMEISKRSGDASVENHKEIQHSEERVASHGTVKELTLKNVSDGDNLNSKYEIVACNATVWPTDSEETSSVKEILSDKDDDQTLSNCTSQLRAETNTSNYTEKEDHIDYMHCTVNKEAVYEFDENAILQENFENRIVVEAIEPLISNIQEDNPLASFEENFENINAVEAAEALINSIQGDNKFASSIVANVDTDEEGFIAEVDTDGIPLIVKKCSSKRQKGKVKILKKRLVSDLIAVVPNEELKCNDENWKSKLKHMSRRRKTEMQRISEAPLCSSQELKAPAEPNLEFVDDKRKVHCQDISCQSLPQDKFVKEERRVKELLSKLLEKKVHEEELVQNGSKKQEASRPEHDLLKDLAHFMANSQIERPSTAPRSHNRKKIQFLKNSMVQNKEAEDCNCFVIENKSTDPTRFHNDRCLKQVQQSGKHEKQKTTGQDKGENDGLCTLQTKSIEHLGKIFKSNCNDSTKHVTMDSENSLLVEDGKKIHQVQQSDKHEKQKTSGQDKEVHVEDTVIGIPSISDDHCQNTEAVNRNMKIGSSDQAVRYKGSTGNNVIIKAQRNNGSCILKSQSFDHLREALNSKRDCLSMIKHCSASLDPAVHDLSSTSFEDHDNGLDESEPSNSCKDDIQNLNNGSENPVTMNASKENSISSLETVAATKKRKAGDRHGVTVLSLRRGTCPNRTQTKKVKQVRLDGITAPPFVPPLLHFDALGNPLKLNHDQPYIIEQSHAALDASIHDFPAASFEANDVKLDESVAHNSHNDDLENHNNGSEQAVLKSTCKTTSLNASQNIDRKRIQPDSSKTASVVLRPFQSNDLGETSKSNRNQMSVIDQSNSSLDASFYGFSATGFECYDNRLDQTVPSNSRKDTLHSQNIDSEQSVPKSACKDTSSNTNKTVAAPTFAQTNAAVSVQPDMSLHRQSRLVNPNLSRDFQNSTNSSSKASQVYHTESYLEGNRDLTSFSTGDNPLLTGPQPIMGENFITDLSLSSPERGFMFEVLVGIVKQREGQVCQKQGTCVTQPIRAFPVLSDFSMGHKPSNKVGFQSSFDCNLPYNTMKTTSLDADPITKADEQQALRSPIILSFAQGNKLDTESTLSRECFDHSKFELMSYIENRIQHYCSSEAPIRIATQKAEKGPQDEDFQIAASQDPDFCSIRKNVPEHRGFKDNPTKKRKVGNRQKMAVLALSADRQSTRNKEARQVQPDSTTRPTVPPLFQSKALETVMNIPDGQSCRREMRVEESHGYKYHQSIIPGENMNTILENPDKQIPKRWKNINGKQAQIESQSLEPAAIALSQTNLRKAKVNSRLKVTIRNTKLSDFACLKNIRHADGTILSQKYVSEAERETAKNKRELDVQCHSTQTGTCATDNHTSLDNNPSSLDLSSAASQFAGFKHVLKPIVQNTQQHLPVSFTADNKDEAAEVSLKASKMIITDSKKKLKVENQLPEIYNSSNLQAIGNYIKWGTLDAKLPTLHASLSKNGAGMPFQTKIDQNGNFMNSSDSGIHPDVDELDNDMLGAAMSRTSPSTFPSHVSNTQVVTSSCSSNTNIGIPHHFNMFNPVCSDVNIMPGLLKPMGMSEQHGLLCQIQEYVDKSKLYVSSFTDADKPLSASFDSSAKKT